MVVADDRVLITGGAGYVGSTLAPLLLSQGFRVRVLDRLEHGAESLFGVWFHPNFELIVGDVCDKATVARAAEGVQAVVHLAAVVGDPACARQPDLARRINLEASLQLIEHSRKIGVRRFVFASTCSNYGRMAGSSEFVDEDSPLAPISVYAETKVAVERELLGRQSEHTGNGAAAATNGDAPSPAPDPCGVGAIALRFATIHGLSPRMRFDLTVNEFTRDIVLQGKLEVFGEQFWRPYVHVVDAARAIALALGAPDHSLRHRVFNVGSTQQNYRKRELVDLMLPYRPDAAVQYVSKQEDPRDYRVQFDRIHRELGYRISRDVQSGIADLAAALGSGVIPDPYHSRYKN